MIEIRHTPGEITVTGHAYYAKYGSDIICAAVSALVYTLVASLEELTTDSVATELSPGHAEIHHGSLSELGTYLVKSFLIGVEALTSEYPDYVTIVESRFR